MAYGQDLINEMFNWYYQGIATIPIRFMSKLPDYNVLATVGAVKEVNGQSVASWDKYKTELPTISEIMKWGTGPLINLAVVTGWQGLVVLDFDNIDLFLQWYTQHPIMTRASLTSRGVHLYLFVREPVRTQTIGGIEVKANGCYVLAPPSIHPSRQAYQWAINWEIMTVDSLEPLIPGLLAPVQGGVTTQYQGGQAQASNPLPVANQDDDPWIAAMVHQGMDTISRIKQAFPILDMLPGPQKPRANGTVSVRCPITRNHKNGDLHTSAWVKLEKQSFFCQVCNPNQGWDVINLYAAINGISNYEAIAELARLLG